MTEIKLSSAVAFTNYNRRPGQYCQPVWQYSRISGDYREEGDWLRHTNETFHPAIRYRWDCANKGTLGGLDSRPWDPVQVREMTTKPHKQIDGRAGVGQPTNTVGPLTWEYDKAATKYGKAGHCSFTESAMGKWEQVYLAYYDQDQWFQSRDPGICKKIMGTDR